jgi:hypothetical protein
MEKIQKRIHHFQKIKATWQKKGDENDLNFDALLPKSESA